MHAKVTSNPRATRLARFAFRTLPVVVALGAGSVLALTMPAVAQPSPGGAAAPAASALPSATNNGAVTTVVVQGGSRSLFKIAVTPPLGDGAIAKQVVDTATRDFTLSSMFQVLDPNSFTANLAQEGASIEPSSWRNIGAEGVVKGNVTPRGQNLHVELRLYVVSRGSDAVLKKEYDVAASSIRSAVHQFDNEVVKYFTGTAGSFGGRLVFSATTGRGQKGIFSVESDGQGLGRLQAVSNVALAPAAGPGGIYYAGGLPDGSYQLFKVGNPAAVLKHAGLVFGVAFGGNKMALVISQNGQSDIWTGAPDGSGLTKVTNGGLNTHPAFGPGGQLAYVSNQGGNPQIFVDGKRVSFRGTYNMAPVFCNDPEGQKILFMGRDGGTWDIFSADLGGGNMKRLTQDQGSNTYPACSPDGRMVAFFSTRGGLFLSNPQGQNQQKIASVTGESLRWEGN
ncbi:MAG: PD40 domain-containing protein [Labilithrix sp.]|nr:PD40 domain-containing protein [Labilithrix sp.]MCW5834219.1 PD40 domain-containing protein [Labilithrix sp.]